MPPLPPLPFEILEQTFFVEQGLARQWLVLRRTSAFLKRLIEPQFIETVLARLTIRLAEVDPQVRPEWLHIEPGLQDGQVLDTWELTNACVAGEDVSFTVKTPDLSNCDCRLWSDSLCDACLARTPADRTLPSSARNTARLHHAMNSTTHWLIHAHTADFNGQNRQKLAKFEAFYTRLPATPAPSSAATITLPWRPLLTFLFTHQREIDGMVARTRSANNRLASAILTDKARAHWAHERTFEMVADFQQSVARSAWAAAARSRRTILRRAAARWIAAPTPQTLRRLADPRAPRCSFNYAACDGPQPWLALTALAPSLVRLVDAAWAELPAAPPTNHLRFVVRALALPHRWIEHGYGWFPARAALYKGAVAPSFANRKRLTYHRLWSREGELLARDERMAQELFDGIRWTRGVRGWVREPRRGFGVLESPGAEEGCAAVVMQDVGGGGGGGGDGVEEVDFPGWAAQVDGGARRGRRNITM